jgi:acrylyl-CoA reductase (NADPH)
MSDTFTALVLRETDDGHVGALEQLTDADLPDGDVTVAVEYSSLNYKDGLALAGRNRIVRSYPMVPGIDLTGTVIASDSPDWNVGDEVISTSFMVGEPGVRAGSAGHRDSGSVDVVGSGPVE